MSDKVDTTELVKIASAFAKAAMAKEMTNPDLEDQLINTMTQDEVELSLGASVMLMGLKQEFGEAAIKNPEYIETAMLLANMIADIHSRVSTEAEVKALLPANAMKEGVSEGFAALGAPKLAKLCARK